MKRYLGLFLAALLAFNLCACGQKTSVLTWQEQYELGVRYLSEGNYEEAIIAFAAAIEIDPKREEAYVALADAYMGLGDYETAEKVLEEGVISTGNTSLQETVEELADDIVERPPYTGKIGDGLADLIDEISISIDEVSIDGIPIRQLTIQEVQHMRPEIGEPIFGIEENEYFGRYDYGTWTWYGEEKLSCFCVRQRFGSSYLTNVRYTGWLLFGKTVVLDVGFRGIHTGDSLVEVLTTLGFTLDGAEQLAKEAKTRAPVEGLEFVLDFAAKDIYLDAYGIGNDVSDYCSLRIELEEGWSIYMDFTQDQRLNDFCAAKWEEGKFYLNRDDLWT